MNILLVRPATPRESINLQSFMICEPLELEYVAAALTEAGHEVDLVDMLLEKKPLTHFLRQKPYRMVCMTGYITNVGVIKDYARAVKAHDPAILTCVGGVHAEVVPTDFVDEHVDCILWANGVKTLLAVAAAYPAVDRAAIPGLYAEGREKPVIENGGLPFPDRRITKKYRDRYNYIYHDRCATLKASFGCPYKCKFCFCTQICPYSERTVADVLDELQEIEEENVFIVDDNFLVSRERVTAFLEGLEARGIRKHYIAFGRADFIAENEDLMIRLHGAGFDAFFVGIESFRNSELSDYAKRSTVETNVRAVEILERNGLQCYSGLIVGEDWTGEDFDTLIRHLNSFDHPLVNIQPITPMPGTPLYDEYPHVIETPREDYALWDMAHVVFRPLRMKKRAYYYHIIRAYLKTSANRKQRRFIRARYGAPIYRRVRRGATRIFFQYLRLMLTAK